MDQKKNAKAANKAKENKPSHIQRMRLFWQNDTTRFVTGLFLFMVAAYLTISFISFFFTGASDQSKLENLSFSELSGIKNQITNWTGSWGAFLAELFINRWVGISAFCISFFLGKAGLKLMLNKDYNLRRLFLFSNIFLIWGSLFFGFFFVSGYEDSFLYLGGYHGYYSTQLLKANIGWPGTFLLITNSFLIILCVVYKPAIDIIRRFFSERLPQFISSLRTKKERETSPAQPEPEVSKKQTATPPADPRQAIYAETPEAPLTQTPVQTSAPDNDPQPVVEAPQDFTNEYVLTTKEETQEETQPWIATKAKPMPTTTAPPIKPENKEAEFMVIKQTTEDTKPVEQIEAENYDPTLDLSNYHTPSYDLLNEYGGSEMEVNMEEQNANKQRIEETLRNYGIEIQAITATVGPTVTLYEIIPKQGVRIAKIRSLEDDIALSLAALGIRIIAPIPGKGTVGIEVPNKDAKIVSMHSVIASRKFQNSDYELPLALGKTITNEVFMIDLAKMPHILVAGATGQGKSVGLNAIITSLLYKKHPSQLKMVLIDPKKVEFNIYSQIENHFLAKLPDAEEAIITDVTKVVATLNSVCKEMDNRYDLLKLASTRNIKEYNAKFVARRLNPEKGHRYMPYIVVIVDEFGDLIMTAGKEIELPIARIAQLARAVGIHMIIATQRPSTNIITGMIKANFPARIAFKVSAMVDSRTILDSPGANQLIGRGDMLFSQGSDLVRVQCAFVDTPEVEEISEAIGTQKGYPTAFLLPEYVPEGSGDAVDVDLRDRDPMFEEAARLVVMNQQGSTSMIQRKFSIGYNRAGRIMDQLEAANIVGPFEGSKARQVLVIDDIQLEQIINNL